MPCRLPALAALLTIALATTGCAQPRPATARGMGWLRPEVEGLGRGRLSLRVQQTVPPPALRLLDLQQLDWDTARAWLSNDRAGFETRRARATALVDATTNVRSAALAFDDLTPSEGYTLVLRLYRGGDEAAFDTDTGTDPAHEAPAMIASGTLAGFPIRAGMNQAALALTLAQGGAFSVAVDEPATVAN
ncbi:MAG: hypothetical protein VKS61_14370 [Candidatus Sericytochromatia bacterium]|nr:hypothetical protein [Candidatus Sericytochromatia bacterium]